jgi:heme exporter protein C
MNATGSTGTRVLGVLSLAGIVALVGFAFGITEADAELGQSIRIMYVHVPTVSTAYMCVIGGGVFSAVWLIKKNAFADVMASSLIEIGTVLLGLTLVTGAIWGNITWGAFWVWDARLTTTALLFLVLIGYIAVRGMTPGQRPRATRSAIVALVGVVLLPIVHKSVDWWNSLHQEKTAFGTLDPDIQGSQLFTLMLSIVVFWIITAWLLLHRFRVGWLAREAETSGLDAAIEARRAEGANA